MLGAGLIQTLIGALKIPGIFLGDPDLLSNILHNYDRLLDINIVKARRLKRAIFLFAVQIAALLILALLA